MTTTELKTQKQEYPPGTRIRLNYLAEEPFPMPRNIRGTVFLVDDVGMVHCEFDNGRQLGLHPDVDSFTRLPLE